MVLSDLLPAEILTIIDAISTAVLAVITYYYAKETGLIRKRGQHPSFSLEPALYRTGNSNRTSEAYKLSLTNNGLPATDIRVDCSWGRQHSSNNLLDTTKKFYIMALSNGGNAILDDIPIEKIANNGERLLVDLTCKDARGEEYVNRFDIDFQAIISENRNVAYQYNATKIKEQEEFRNRNREIA
jgi:hypothetical protein